MKLDATESLKRVRCPLEGCGGRLKFGSVCAAFPPVFFSVVCKRCGESFAQGSPTKQAAWDLFAEIYISPTWRQRAKRAAATALEYVAKELRK